MSRVLLVDDDTVALEILSYTFRREGFEVLTATHGHRAIEIGCESPPDAAIIDLKLPDMIGLDIIREFSRFSLGISSIVVTGFGTTQTAVEAVKLGAYDYLEKPVDADKLIFLVKEIVACHSRGSQQRGLYNASASACHASARWAEIVVRVIDAPVDPTTLYKWGRCVAASPGAIRNWCRTAGLAARPSLKFARVLRAVVRSAGSVGPEELLDVVDVRTLGKLLRLGRTMSLTPRHLPMSIDDFLTTQCWISSENALEEVRIALRARCTIGRRSA